jgi:hypothetical protein
MVDIRALRDHVAKLVVVAVRTWLVTALAVAAYGAVLAGGAYYLLNDRPLYGVLVAVVTMAVAVGGGAWLGAQWAADRGISHALTAWGLGSALVRLLFDRLLGVSGDQQHGERGTVIAQAAEKLPLAQAEERLSRATEALVKASPAGGSGGWLRRRLNATLLGGVQRITLTRFREDGARHGGVDLLKLRSELEGKVDELLLGRLRFLRNLWSALVLLGLPLLMYGLVTLVRTLQAPR